MLLKQKRTGSLLIMLSVFGGTGVVVTVVSVLLLAFNLISPSTANTSSGTFYKITCVMHM